MFELRWRAFCRRYLLAMVLVRFSFASYSMCVVGVELLWSPSCPIIVNEGTFWILIGTCYCSTLLKCWVYLLFIMRPSLLKLVILILFMIVGLLKSLFLMFVVVVDSLPTPTYPISFNKNNFACWYDHLFVQNFWVVDSPWCVWPYFWSWWSPHASPFFLFGSGTYKDKHKRWVFIVTGTCTDIYTWKAGGRFFWSWWAPHASPCFFGSLGLYCDRHMYRHIHLESRGLWEQPNSDRASLALQACCPWLILPLLQVFTFVLTFK